MAPSSVQLLVRYKVVVEPCSSSSLAVPTTLRPAIVFVAMCRFCSVLALREKTARCAHALRWRALEKSGCFRRTVVGFRARAPPAIRARWTFPTRPRQALGQRRKARRDKISRPLAPSQPRPAQALLRERRLRQHGGARARLHASLQPCRGHLEAACRAGRPAQPAREQRATGGIGRGRVPRGAALGLHGSMSSSGVWGVQAPGQVCEKLAVGATGRASGVCLCRRLSSLFR